MARTSNTSESKVLTYFMDAPVTEAAILLGQAKTIMARRTEAAAPPKVRKPRKGRKAKATPVAVAPAVPVGTEPEPVAA